MSETMDSDMRLLMRIIEENQPGLSVSGWETIAAKEGISNATANYNAGQVRPTNIPFLFKAEVWRIEEEMGKGQRGVHPGGHPVTTLDNQRGSTSKKTNEELGFTKWTKDKRRERREEQDHQRQEEQHQRQERRRQMVEDRRQREQERRQLEEDQ
ncbi:hypothetical protein PG995_003168 [Apiospora arundinis]